MHRCPSACINPFASFARDKRGQDLIEYALLSAFIGCAGAAVFLILTGSMGTAYSSWNDSSGGIQTTAVVEMPDPQ